MTVAHEAESSHFEGAGAAVSSVAATVTFVVVYAAVVHSAGWAIGLTLGWIPASLAASVVMLAGLYLLPLTAWLLTLAAIGLTSFMIWH